jgi:hypothetical protein
MKGQRRVGQMADVLYRQRFGFIAKQKRLFPFVRYRYREAVAKLRKAMLRTVCAINMYQCSKVRTAVVPNLTMNREVRDGCVVQNYQGICRIQSAQPATRCNKWSRRRVADRRIVCYPLQ